MAAGDLTTLEKVKAHFEVKNSTDDGLLTHLITAASDFIRTYCSRDLAATDYVESRNGHGGRVLVLPNYPIISVASVKVDGVAITSAAGSPTLSGYVFDQYSISLRGYVFSKGFKNVELSYRAGFETIPLDLEQACIDLVGLKFKERTRIGETSKSVAGATTSYSTDDMPAHTKSVLEFYSRRVMQ